LTAHIRQHIAASRLHGEGYRKLWARLRFAGVRTSPRHVRRVMRENGVLAPHRVGRTETKPHDGTIITDKVNEMWRTDMTQTITIREGQANVFVAVEHANSQVVGIHASRSANRFEALEPCARGCIFTNSVRTVSAPIGCPISVRVAASFSMVSTPRSRAAWDRRALRDRPSA
jgi:hypothetical protein